MDQIQESPAPQQDSPSQAPQSLNLDEAVAHYAEQLNNAEPISDPDSAPTDSVEPAAGPSDEPEPQEQKAPEPKPEPKEEQPAPNSKLASLIRREQAFEEKRQAWQRENAEKIKAVEEFDRLKARAKDDPFTALRALGHEDGRKFLEMIAETGGKMTPEQQRIYELEQQVNEDRAARAKAQEEAQQQAEERTRSEQLRAWHTDIEKYMSQEPEFKDSIANVPNVAPAVFDVMQAHYSETGERMPYKQAVTQVAQNIESRVGTMLQELSGNKRGQQLLLEYASKLNKPAPASKKAPLGITQRISNSTGAKRKDPPRLDEALSEATSWLNGQLS